MTPKLPLSRKRLLEALRREIRPPSDGDTHLGVWQAGRSSLAAYLYGAVALGEFDASEGEEENND